MPTPLKILIGLFCALFLLIVSAAIALPLIIDPNDYRDTIAEKVEAETGREFRMSGDLSLTVFPWLGVETNAVSLANAPDYLKLPNVICVGGSWVAPKDMVARGDWDGIRKLAEEACATLKA